MLKNSGLHASPCHAVFLTPNLRLCGCNSSFLLIAYINTVIWFSRSTVHHMTVKFWQNARPHDPNSWVKHGKRRTDGKLSTHVPQVPVETLIKSLKIKEHFCFTDANKEGRSLWTTKCVPTAVWGSGYAPNIQQNLLWSQVHLLLIWTGSQRGRRQVQRVKKGSSVRTRAPTYREKTLNDKSTEPSLGMLVLINDIKVKGHQTASGAHTSNTRMCRSRHEDTANVFTKKWPTRSKKVALLLKSGTRQTIRALM